MNPEILEKAKQWASNPYFDQAFRAEIENLIQKGDEEELADRFYKDLEFGTGGLRGIIGAGANRMNIYTVRKATQGLADYILESTKDSLEKSSVAIAYDCRNFSDTFSMEAASVLAANGIKVHLFPTLRPTPMLSFAVRELKATSGIVVTASHNPPEYNGYKAYWNDGCQVTPPQDIGIINKVNQIVDFNDIRTMDFRQGIDEGIISIIPGSLDQTYYDKVEGLSLSNPETNAKFPLIFTALHGSGNIPVREILKRRGFTKVKIVAEQELPDGNFSTVKSPNPEEASALELAVQQASDEDRLILATDPDADRVGAMVKHQGEWIKINGNQIGQLLLDYYLNELAQKNQLPSDGVYVTTIVTSELGKKIAEKHGVRCEEVLTGFKYIGSVMRELEIHGGGTFLFGTEESHGYLVGSFVRDKDAVIACMVFAELCAALAEQGKTALDRLEEIHAELGYHQDSLVNKTIKGFSGAEQIQKIMASLRSDPPKTIAGVAVKTMKDYQQRTIIDCQSGAQIGTTDQPKSNVLAFYMADGSRITARPSGTEPKIKFYFNLCGSELESLKKIQKQYEEDFVRRVDQV